MEKELFIANSVEIRAPVPRVWKLLTDPSETKKYMFGCEVITDWKEGQPIVWKGVFDGNEIIAVSGKVKAYRPEQFLAYTAFDPNSTMLDIPQNHTTVTYQLSPIPHGTRLEVKQGDFAKVADGQRRYDESLQGGGWDPILQEIKKLAESR